MEGFLKVYYRDSSLDYPGKITFPVQNVPAPANYSFPFQKLGNWANIDCLARDSRTRPVHFCATLPDSTTFTNPGVYLVFRDKKIFIPGYKSAKYKGFGFSHGDFEIPRLPVGAEAAVVFVAYKNDVPYFALKRIIIAEDQEVKLTPVASTEKEIKRMIAVGF